MVDEEKIRAQIEQNKKPKKKSKFQQRMEDIVATKKEALKISLIYLSR